MTYDFAGRRRYFLIVALLVASLVVSGFVWAHKNVTVVADGHLVSISTLSNNPTEILLEAGVNMQPIDEYVLSTEKVQDGTVIQVHRAVPVSLIYQGKTSAIMTPKQTVGEVVTAQGYTLSHVKVVPGVDVPVTADMQVQIIGLTSDEITVADSVPYTVNREPDPNMELGQEEVVQEGKDGAKTSKVKRYYEDGKNTSQEVIAEKITVQPVPKIVKVGTRSTVETSRGSMDFRRVAYMEASAYTPADGDGHGITATGMAAGPGIVAVDPAVIPLGTRVYIPGYGRAIAADTGSAIRGSRIDLCMDSHGEAISFGRQTVKVYILD